MKILTSLLFLTLGVNANEVVYGSKHGEFTEQGEIYYTKLVPLLELREGEIFEVVGTSGFARRATTDRSAQLYLMIQYGNQQANGFQSFEVSKTGANQNGEQRGQRAVGPCKVFVRSSWYPDNSFVQWQVGYKITKLSAAGTTTSAPILLPPTQDAAKSWFVKLQVSSDLKAWDDVAPGQFLGSDTARFFRIQTTEAE